MDTYYVNCKTKFIQKSKESNRWDNFFFFKKHNNPIEASVPKTVKQSIIILLIEEFFTLVIQDQDRPLRFLIDNCNTLYVLLLWQA